MEIAAYHIPGYKGELVRSKAGNTSLVLPKLTPDDMQRAADYVKEQGAKVLSGYTTDDLADIFGRTAQFWQQPSGEKTRVVTAISDVTGLSREVVDRSITVEQGNSGTADILAAMDRELGDHRVLDGFVEDAKLKGRTRAFGPPLVAAVLTANVPGLSYLPMVRSLMVKSPLIAKLSSGEPIFGPAWVKSLARLAPDLAECIALFCWRGANPDFEEKLFDPASTIILYGGPQSIRRLREKIGPNKKILEHGHKVGVAMIGREKLSGQAEAKKLAEKLAYDVAMFDQRACIAPQMAYVETGGAVSSDEFAEMVSAALSSLAEELPPSSLSLDTAATLAQDRNLAAFNSAQTENMRVLVNGTATVVHEPEPGFDSVLPTRYIRIFPVADLKETLPLLEEHGPYLQNIGMAVDNGRLDEISDGLAKAGVSHITSIGLMHRPTMRWRHDGMSAFGEMVRWTDIEMIEQG